MAFYRYLLVTPMFSCHNKNRWLLNELKCSVINYNSLDFRSFSGVVTFLFWRVGVGIQFTSKSVYRHSRLTHLFLVFQVVHTGKEANHRQDHYSTPTEVDLLVTICIYERNYKKTPVRLKNEWFGVGVTNLGHFGSHEWTAGKSRGRRL